MLLRYLKKIFYNSVAELRLLLAAMASLACGASAQEEATLYNFNDAVFIIEGYETPVCGVFNHVSNNGKYAVGADDQISMTSYYWSADAPDVINMPWDPSRGYSTLNDVTNDGVMAGSVDSLLTGETYVRQWPATFTLDGGWKLLPVPENYSSDQSNEFNSMRTINCVRAVSSDGKYMAGQVYVSTGEIDEDFGIEKVKLLPVVWENNEIKKVYDDLGINTFYVYGISEDGSTVVGVNTAENGGQNPAYIKDGKLYNVFSCDDPETNTFNGGILCSIDAEGNMYGYFLDNSDVYKYFSVKADGSIVYFDQLVTCAGGGYKFGPSVAYDENGDAQAVPAGGMYSLLDCSTDGKVLAGGETIDIGFGVVNCPAMIVSKGATGISKPEAVKSDVSIDYRKGGTLYVNGEYNSAEIYGVGGNLVMKGGQGEAFNLSSLPSGTYVVKVSYNGGSKTFKVLR